VDADRVARVTEVLRRGFANEELHPATSQALNARKAFLAPLSFFRASEKTEALAAIDAGACIASPLMVESVDAVVAGNFTEQTLDSISALLSSQVSVECVASAAGSSEQGVTVITSEQTITESTLNEKEPTSCLIMYYQIASEFSVEKSAVADVLADLMSEPFFDCLRTEEQLGYSVQCGARSTNGSIGLEFSIQSSSETPGEMVNKVEKFIAQFFKREIADMSNDEFDEQLESLIEGLTEPPTSLAREARDIWSEVTENRFCWNFNELIKKEIETRFVGKRKSIDALIKQYLVKDKRVIVQVNGDGKMRVDNQQ
jgi:secreted Zn-dependent insulinase-like peptidase